MTMKRRRSSLPPIRRSDYFDVACDLRDLGDQVTPPFAIVQNANLTTELMDLRTKRPIMCNFHDEIVDAMEFVEIAHGRVVVLGLGLGMIVRMLLVNPDVESIDVVEIERTVIEMVGPSVESDRVRIHHGDALDPQTPRRVLAGDRAACVWADVFPCSTRLSYADRDRSLVVWGPHADAVMVWRYDESAEDAKKYLGS